VGPLSIRLAGATKPAILKIQISPPKAIFDTFEI
jgi:hypothetical protein